jgi:tRNA(Ile)-lysidine synthase
VYLVPESLESFLNQSQPLARLYIGFSGGIDSHVLLHLCAEINSIKDKITAVYVHHGLQEQADYWSEHCQMIAEKLGLGFLALTVDAKATKGESPEESARNARYQAFQSLIEVNDVLLIAQHREDQMETVLLQLIRGSGLRGLSGMPEQALFGKGKLLRPLLHVSKLAIIEYAKKYNLHWVEDPSNQEQDFNRNYLRHEILPKLKQRWPSVDRTFARSARHCADAQQIISELLEELFSSVYHPEDQTLNLITLETMPSNRKNWLLRRWFEILGLKPPSQALLQTIIDQAVCARIDANLEIRTQHHCIRRYQNKLFCIVSHKLSNAFISCSWPADTKLVTSNGYCLSIRNSSSGICSALWNNSAVTVKTRSGGEKIKLLGRKGHHDLKKLFQEAGIPPWERDIRPLIYLNQRLAAVAGLWIDEWAWSEGPDACYQLKWEPASHLLNNNLKF